jgi:hypothetical protein
MALVVADRVQETTTTTGTGTVTLAGASAGYQSFAAIGDGNTTYYTITSGNDWEVGVGTYTASGTTLARTTVLASSAGGTTKITLSGTSNVFVTYPAEIATMLTNPVATNGGVVYGTGTAINVSAAGTVNGYQFLQSAGAASPTWVQINSFKDVAVAPSSPAPIEGDRFFDNTTGIDYTYITDADGSQWVETAPGNLASVAGGSSTQVQYNNAGILGGITGATTNGTVLTLTTPVLGAATGTSLALGGATLGSNALAVTGSSSFPGSTTITAAGLVGIGMTPSNILDITQNQNGASVIKVLNNSAGANAQALVQLSDGTNNAYMAFFGTGGAGTGPNNPGSFSIQTQATGGMNIATTAAYPIKFHLNNAEAARFDSSGNFQFGTTTSVGAASFGVTMFPNGSVQVSQNTTGAAAVLAFYNPNGGVGSIQTSGSSTSYITSSDYRLKENVQPMTGGLATVAALKPVNYDWIIDKSAGEGFIAHELQAVIPAAVTGEKDAVDDKGEIKPQGVDFSKIVPHLVAAIQELTTRLAALEAK